MIAWQRQIRDARARLRLDHDLFGAPWAGCDLTLRHSQVRAIDRATAASLIQPYEWLGTMPAVTRAAYGLYFGGVLGGAIVFAPDPAQNLGVWDRYGWGADRLWLLARGACAHWTPTGSASRLIRRAMRCLPASVAVVTALVDAEAGEIGTIYQACGFDYVGPMGHGRVDGRTASGATLSERQLRREDADSLTKFARLSTPATVRRVPSRGRYFAFRGPDAAQERAKLAARFRPYPKRRPPERKERNERTEARA